MKEFESFINHLNILKNADFEFASENDIYRTGVIGHSLTLHLNCHGKPCRRF